MRGEPEPRSDLADERTRRLARMQGLFFVATGLWPLVHMRSFEAVTGRKREKWLVKTTGLLIATIGVSLLAGARRRLDVSAAVVGLAAPAALAAVDIVYVAKKRISNVYLVDAILELGFVSAWAWHLDAWRSVQRRDGARATPSLR